ncbi:tyrosine-type recombinase/integrase [Pedobacter punctiformis]|uniref:Tyrosine-type recombinase/integrase n=1 Tax=Pedobacter punctiformis TaxID=3004097 RepID=A0ABT4LC00_9SPHI|nr:tyrosine-type recombinase/integrase [Pedobacter sp. HCMS5-2]MCZ4245440.1 tyrosine-type recombinase/integrase [Pedobacter sp. HCMS5-2]
MKFKAGLNKSGINKKEQEKRIRKAYNAIHDLLTTKIYDGKDFNEINKKQVMPSFNHAADAYLENRKLFLSDKSIRNYELGINFFKKYLQEINMPYVLLDCIDGELLENYIVYMKEYISPRFKKSLSKFTIKEYKERLGAILEFWFSKKRVLTHNPIKSIRIGYELIREQKDNSTVFSVEQLQSIFDYVKKHRKPPYLTFLLLIYYAHLRPIEICRLEIKDFDLEKRMIYLKAAKSKTRIARKITLDAPMHNHLLSIGVDFKKPEIQNYYLFSNHGNGRITYLGEIMYKHKSMSYSFKTMLTDLGINTSFTKYHLKHTANVHELVYEGLSFTEVQIKNGHTLSKTTEVYLKDLKEFYLENQKEEKERVLKFNI